MLEDHRAFRYYFVCFTVFFLLLVIKSFYYEEEEDMKYKLQVVTFIEPQSLLS